MVDGIICMRYNSKLLRYMGEIQEQNFGRITLLFIAVSLCFGLF